MAVTPFTFMSVSVFLSRFFGFYFYIGLILMKLGRSVGILNQLVVLRFLKNCFSDDVILTSFSFIQVSL